jgi:MFS family permease
VSKFENSPDSNPPPIWRRYLQLPRNVLALSLVSLLNDISSETIYPLLPFFLTLTLGASPFAIGMIEGAAESVSSLLKLFAGYFSDRFSKRKLPILAGYGLSGAVRPFLGLAVGWPQVLLLRLADRIGKGIRSAPRDALVADSVTPEKRGLAFGFHRAMDNLGAVIGPLVAYFLLRFLAADQERPTSTEYSQVFLLASIPALLTIAVVALFVREDPKFKTQNLHSKELINKKSKQAKFEFDSNFKRFLFILTLFTLANSSDAFLLLRAQEAGIAPANIPLLWTFLSLVKVFSSLIGGDLSDKIGRKILIFSGWILYAAVYAGFAFVTTVSGAWALFLIYGVYFGLTEGAEKALVSDLVPAARRGAAFGWYHLAFGIAVFPASLLTGVLWKFFGASTSFLTCALISLTAAFLFLTVNTRQTSDKI